MTARERLLHALDEAYTIFAVTVWVLLFWRAIVFDVPVARRMLREAVSAMPQ